MIDKIDEIPSLSLSLSLSLWLDRIHPAERSMIFKSNHHNQRIKIKYYRSACLSLVSERPSRSNLKNKTEHSVPPGAHMTTQPTRRNLQTNSFQCAACSLATKAQDITNPHLQALTTRSSQLLKLHLLQEPHLHVRAARVAAEDGLDLLQDPQLHSKDA
jgi:hypothetical protein